MTGAPPVRKRGRPTIRTAFSQESPLDFSLASETDQPVGSAQTFLPRSHTASPGPSSTPGPSSSRASSVLGYSPISQQNDSAQMQPQDDSAQMQPQDDSAQMQPQDDLDIQRLQIDPDNSTATETQTQRQLGPPKTHIFSNDTLKSLGLVIHETLKFFLCVSCSTGVKPGQLSGHLKTHGITLDQEKQNQLNELYDQFSMTDHPSNPDNLEPVEFLEIKPGFPCSKCTYACPKKSTFKNHWSGDHSDLGTAVITAGFIQTIFKGPHKKYFAVDPNFRSGVPSLFSEYKKLRENRSPGTFVPQENTREIPPLLRYNGWHKHLEEYFGDGSKENLRNELSWLARPPQSQKRLKSGVLAYVHKFREQASSCPDEALKHLVEYPRMTLVGPWFAAINEDTVSSYAKPATAFLYALMMTQSSPATYQYNFPLTEEQRATVQELIQVNEDENPDAKFSLDLIHRGLSIGFIQTEESTDISSWSMPLECFIAIHSLRPEGTWVQAKHFTPFLAQLTYLIRGTLLYEAIKRCNSNPTLTPYESVKDLAKLNIAVSSCSPYILVRNKQSVASTIAMADSQNPRVDISLNGMDFAIDGIKINIPDMRLGFQRLVDTIKKKLAALLGPEEIDYTHPSHDSMGNFTNGYSAIDEDKHQAADKFMNHLLKTRKLCNQTNTGKPAWKRKAVESVLVETAEINKLLAVATYCLAGQPPRAAELVDGRLRNGFRQRSLYFLLTGTWYVITRVKTGKGILSGQEVYLPRLYPPEVAKLVKQFYIIVRPIEEFLASQIWSSKVASYYRDYMWVTQTIRLSEKTFSTVLERTMNEYCGAKISVNPWRHLSVAIVRTYADASVVLDDDYDDDEDIFSEQRGHNPKTTSQHYGVEIDQLRNLSSDKIRKFAKGSKVWWQIMGFDPSGKLAVPLDAFEIEPIPKISDSRRQHHQALTESSLSDMKTLFSEILDEKFHIWNKVIDQKLASHRAQLKEDMKGSMVSSLAHHVAKTTANLLGSQSNTNFTQFSEPPFTFEEVSPDIQMNSPEINQEMQTSIPVASQSQMIDPQTLLEKLYGPGAKFKSEFQKKIVTLALQGKESFAAVTGTGGGKSLTFLLPCLLPDPGYVVAILPNVSLVNDMTARAQKHNIPVHNWTSSNQDAGDARLVIVGIEAATSDQFKTWCRINKDKIKLFVLDEAHQAMTELSYRTAFDNTQEMAAHGKARVFITATLAPADEQAWRKAVGFWSWEIYRDSTVRPEISYHAHWIGPLSPKLEITAAKCMIKTFTSHMESRDRGILFVPTRPGAEKIAAAVGGVAYHGKLDDKVKKKNQDQWKEKTQWIIATSAFFHGIDYPYVKFVLYLDAPESIYHKVQGDGRGGRANEKSYSICYWQTKDPSSKFLDDPGLSGHIKTKLCRRIALSEYMDGQAVQCGEIPDAHLCDNCDRDQLLVGKGAKLGKHITNLVMAEDESRKYDVYDDPDLLSEYEGVSEFEDAPNVDESKGKRKLSVDESEYRVPIKAVKAHADASPASLTLLPGLKQPSGRTGFKSIAGGSQLASGYTSQIQSQHGTPSQSGYNTPLRQAVPGPGVLGFQFDAEILEKQQDIKGQKSQDLNEILERLRERCFTCSIWFNKDSNGEHVPVLYCGKRSDMRKDVDVHGWKEKFKKKVDWKKGICWKCGFPQGKYAPPDHPKNENISGFKDCPYASQLLGAIWMMFLIPKIWNRIKEEMGAPDTVEKLTKWLPDGESNTRFSNAIEVFLWYCKYGSET